MQSRARRWQSVGGGLFLRNDNKLANREPRACVRGQFQPTLQIGVEYCCTLTTGHVSLLNVDGILELYTHLQEILLEWSALMRR